MMNGVNSITTSPNTTQAKASLRGARIMIVEDDVNLLEGIQTVLELDKYIVTAAENGRQALEILQSATLMPDLIVSDIMMPQMDGIEFLQQVRMVQSWISIPFIFLTARGEKTDIQRAKQLGVDDYLIKPFDADDLLIAIESRLTRTRAVQNLYLGEMSDLKKRILTILNHEFRTPLTYVVAYADLLEEANQTALNDGDVAVFLKGVSTGAIRLRRLIENFIQLVEMETGDAARTFEMRRAPILDVQDLLKLAVRDVMDGRVVQQSINVVVDKVPMFIADAAYLKTSLIHLLDNAVKFSGHNTVITLGAHQVDHEVCFWVQDQGRGIDHSEHKRIWETFYQINRPRFEDPGTGTGLAIVDAVAKLHSGRATVESELEKGSRFSIYVPI